MVCMLVALLSACATTPSSTVSYPSGLPSGGRAKPYTVWGKTYYPLKSAHGFVEEGVASWYGKDFHGKKTANGERYNMYDMTAAHKLLPFNTRVKVTNLTNGKSIVVRINDRGPFVSGRVIDLTYTGANRIGMLGPGTARVRVETIGTVPGLMQNGDLSGAFYVQIGAFSSRANAAKLVARLQSAGYGARTFYAGNVGLWRVQAGPWRSLNDASRASWRLHPEFPGSFVVSN